jgi:hemoglobin
MPRPRDSPTARRGIRRTVDHVEPEGGDPACWAHLFEDEDEDEDEDPPTLPGVPVIEPPPAEGTLFERAGGQTWFDALVERFYEGVEQDPVLRPLYPDDLEPGKRHLALFLAQYWGGPGTYSEERGHPRLRMRHAPFAIGSAERDAWVRHMTAAVQAGGLSPEDEARVLAHATDAAHFLQNHP